MYEVQRLGQEIQPEQEPVAWMRDDEMKAMVSDEKRAWILCGRSELIEEYNKPLYNTPPQRTWVGLTPEEVEACFHHVDEAGIGLFDFAEAIEAKLKEKNNA
jgi:hypothetical protein